MAAASSASLRKALTQQLDHSKEFVAGKQGDERFRDQLGDAMGITTCCPAVAFTAGVLTG
ncbi:hypothetical protein POF50_008755 [Streptomyces sp. SL13]|uniref:Uncharacterized protein n=1 Tax=Streptantibioticus silvisoli TaxID=2705255 RepID=A0AA90GWZ7_9ACTN|nr:hypothetical protein [Streptantibioticus silvisoli]MDI5969429.1 hypothetical protein [Streptantibioticus silvisoli]